MTNYYDPIIAEVRERRAQLIEKYGGWEGYEKHLDEERPRLEKEGWHFETAEEFAERTAEQNVTV